MNYFENPAVNCSLLKKLAIHPKMLTIEKEEEEDSEAILIGSLVDAYLTDPEQVSKYVALESPKLPSDNIQQLAKDYIKFNDLDQAIANNPLSEKGKVDTIKSRFEKEGTQYYNYLLSLQEYIQAGKKIITIEQERLAKEVSTSLLTHTFTKHHFTESPECNIWYQKELYWNMLGVPCKAKFDLIRINHVSKTVYLNDIKVIGQSSLDFMNSFKRFKYYLQAAFYLSGFRHTYGNELKDYTILPFNFIVGSSKYPNTPLNWSISDSDMNLGQFGGEVNDVKFKGYEQLIADYLWHTENNLYDYPREVYQNNGTLVTTLV